MVVKFEDFHKYPETTVRMICKFLDIPFEKIMIQDEKWKENIDEEIIKVNVSAFTKQKVYGFNPTRSETWKTVLKNWELALCDNLAGEYLEKMGYKKFFKSEPLDHLQTGFNFLNDNEYLKNTLNNFKKKNISTDKYPIDPADPKNWSAPGDGFKKFTESNAYDGYKKDLRKLSQRLTKSYDS